MEANLTILAINLQYRINLLKRLGKYIVSGDSNWQKAKEKASVENPWFTPEFIDIAVRNIAELFLKEEILQRWVKKYNVAEENKDPKTVGIIMAGNIPMVGFHDLLSVFISGNKAIIKPSTKDNVLIRHLVDELIDMEPIVKDHICFEEMLKGCDAYIATGSNNSSRYFEYYFGKYPNIIRRNKTSVAILSGEESIDELEKLTDDVFLYFGLGCRNITKIYVPENYDFIPLLEGFKKYNYLADHHKYKNNFDYNLTLHILNKKFYMTNGVIILSENDSFFSQVSQLNYEFYNDKQELIALLNGREELQCIVGEGFTPFGRSQCPQIDDYADATDTLSFLIKL